MGRLWEIREAKSLEGIGDRGVKAVGRQRR